MLRSGGEALILVPLRGEATNEDASVTDPLERERRFGQFDHLRVYGMDFVGRMEAAGFAVRVLRQEELGLGEGEMERLGLEAGEVAFLGLKGVIRELR